MLEMNPYFRPSAKEILKNSYFDEVRIPEYEHSSNLKLSLDLDNIVKHVDASQPPIST